MPEVTDAELRAMVDLVERIHGFAVPMRWMTAREMDEEWKEIVARAGALRTIAQVKHGA